MSPVPPIEASRLRLVSLSTEVLRLLQRGDLRAAETIAGFAVPDPCALTGHDWVERRCSMIEDDSAQHPWMNRAIVRKEDDCMVGNISFHHKAPDPHLQAYAPCAAELGYTIEEPYRRNGYARESALAMMRWALQEHGVTTFILSISPENLPSLRLAEAMGFQTVGEHIDDVDGLEWVMQAGAAEIPGL